MKNKLNLLIIVLSTVIISCKENNKIDKTPQRPNILFAIMDDATYMHMGAYGCSWVKTPNFDKIATNGLLFNNAYTNNAKCAPSRSIILTGRNSWQLEEAANHWSFFPEKFKTFTEVLNEQGYNVGYTGKGWAPGIAKKSDGTTRELLVNAYKSIKTTPPTSKISNIDYAANFEAFLNRQKKSKDKKPFFFWYGGSEPHREYEYKSGILKGGKSISQISDKDIYTFWPVTDSIKIDMLDYAFEIEYFDKQLGKMIQKLKDIGELDNTLVVVTSDNGMPFPRIKGQEYEYSNHLPLAIMWPDGIKYTNRKIDDYISFNQFATTFLTVAGVNIDSTGMKPMVGKSFNDLFHSNKTSLKSKKDNYVLIGKERHDVGRPNDMGYPIRGIIKDSMLYLHNFKTDRWPAGNPETGYLNTDGAPTKTVVLNTIYNKETIKYWQWNFGKRSNHELYDISKDPDCLNNLAFKKDYEVISKKLQKELFNKLKAQKDPRMFDNGDVFDNYPYANKGGKNFYERYKAKDKNLSWNWVNDSDFQDLSNIKIIQDSL